MNNFFQPQKTNAGFAMLYAVIVIAVLSSLGSVLSNLIVRESNLSATSRESSRAYYSADAGVECAQYWDLQEDAFPPPSGDHNNAKDSVSCSDDTGINVDANDVGGDHVYEIDTINNSSANICADVTVTKEQDNGRLLTIIESVGKDSCAGSTRVQRSIRSTY